MASKAWYFHSPFKFVASVREQRRPWSNCADWSGQCLQMFGRHVLTQSSWTLKAPSKIYRRHKNKTKLKMSVCCSYRPFNPLCTDKTLQHYKLEESNLILGVSGCVSYIFIETNDYTISKKWIPWSEAAFCGVLSGSALFASYPFTGLPSTMWVNAASDQGLHCLYPSSIFVDTSGLI